MCNQHPAWVACMHHTSNLAFRSVGWALLATGISNIFSNLIGTNVIPMNTISGYQGDVCSYNGHCKYARENATMSSLPRPLPCRGEHESFSCSLYVTVTLDGSHAQHRPGLRLTTTHTGHIKTGSPVAVTAMLCGALQYTSITSIANTKMCRTTPRHVTPPTLK